MYLEDLCKEIDELDLKVCSVLNSYNITNYSVHVDSNIFTGNLDVSDCGAWFFVVLSEALSKGLLDSVQRDLLKIKNEKFLLRVINEDDILNVVKNDCLKLH